MKKITALLILLFAVLLTACDSPQDFGKRPVPQELIKGNGEARVELPVAYKWEGITDLASGSLTTSTKGSEGAVSANIGGDVGGCKGKWERKSGKPKTVAVSDSFWHMRCDSGLTASGTFKMTGRRDGWGLGRDAQGRLIKFRVGGSIVKHDAMSGMSDAQFCAMLTGNGDRDVLVSMRTQDLIDELDRRKLSLEDCKALVKAN